MPRTVSIPYRLVASPGEKGFKEVYTVPAGYTLKVCRVHVHFPIASAGELRIALYYGQSRVYPEADWISGSDIHFDDPVDLEWFSGDGVRVWFKNTNTVEERSCDLKLEGVLQ